MFNWSGYLRLAEELATREQDEAAQRSAVSRAYYAVFGKARDRLRTEGFEVPRRATHRFVWSTFRRSRELHWWRIGVDGDRLKEYREKADYENSLPGLRKITRHSIEIAAGVLRFLEQ